MKISIVINSETLDTLTTDQIDSTGTSGTTGTQASLGQDIVKSARVTGATSPSNRQV